MAVATAVAVAAVELAVALARGPALALALALALASICLPHTKQPQLRKTFSAHNWLGLAGATAKENAKQSKIGLPVISYQRFFAGPWMLCNVRLSDALLRAGVVARGVRDQHETEHRISCKVIFDFLPASRKVGTRGALEPPGVSEHPRRRDGGAGTSRRLCGALEPPGSPSRVVLSHPDHRLGYF